MPYLNYPVYMENSDQNHVDCFTRLGVLSNLTNCFFYLTLFTSICCDIVYCQKCLDNVDIDVYCLTWACVLSDLPEYSCVCTVWPSACVLSDLPEWPCVLLDLAECTVWPAWMAMCSAWPNHVCTVWPVWIFMCTAWPERVYCLTCLNILVYRLTCAYVLSDLLTCLNIHVDCLSLNVLLSVLPEYSAVLFVLSVCTVWPS